MNRPDSTGSRFSFPKTGMMPREEMLEVGKKQQKLVIGIPKEDHKLESRVALTPKQWKSSSGTGMR